MEVNPKPRIAVTGVNPEVLPSSVVDTNIAFIDLLRSAKNKILIMGYRFTEHGKDDFIKNIEELLGEGKRVWLLTDHVFGQDKYLKNFFIKLLSKHSNLFRLWTFEDEEKTIMHIKSIVIDSERMYLGSANFSRRGITENIELGTVMYDSEAIKTVKAVFTWLTTEDDRVTEVTVRELRTHD